MSNKIDSKANYIATEASTDPVDLMLTKYWFANKNKELSEKRSKEEAYLFINEWSTAKQRIEEEIVSK